MLVALRGDGSLAQRLAAAATALAGLCLPLLACTESTSAQSQSVTQSELAPNDHAVVALLRDGNVACTGALIAPLVVLTARHCIPDPAGSVQLAFGVDPVTAEIRTSRVHWLPASIRHDVGLILLDQPAPTWAVPAKIRSTALDQNDVNRPLRIVGFGSQSFDDETLPMRRTGIGRITAVADFDFDYVGNPSQACLGDSGGPSFLTSGSGVEEIVGVTSSGDDACVVGGSNARLDALVDSFILPFIGASQPGSAATGEICFGDDTCAEGTCYLPDDAPTYGYCTKVCVDGLGCPSGMVCEDELCTHPLPSPGATGALCDDPLHCASRLCKAAESEPGVLRCTNYCSAEANSCASDHRCEPIAEQEGVSGCFPGSGPEEESGCSIAVGRTQSGSAALWLMLFVVVVLPRLRSRGRRR